MELEILNLVNDNRNPAANQFVVKLKGKTYFQSYDKIIAMKDKEGKISLSKHWKDSNTTRKHLYIWLRDYTTFRYVCSEADVNDAIKNGYITIKKLTY